jgi:hypothetical protein
MKKSLLKSSEAKNFWVDNLGVVENFFAEKVWDLNYPKKIPALSLNTADKLPFLIRMEKKFVSTVLSRVNQVLNANQKKVVLLFDIDDTLGVSLDPEAVATTFRPSAIPLIKLLAEYCTIGILSNRLALTRCDIPEIFDYLDSDMIFSSRDASVLYCEKSFQIKHNLVRDGKISLTDSSNLNKLTKLDIVTKKYNNYFFVTVDDLPYADSLGMNGIYIGQYLQCYL